MDKYVINSYTYSPTCQHNKLAWAAIRRFASRNQNKPMRAKEYASVVPRSHPIGTADQHIGYVIAHGGLELG